jgi:antitoxin CptB
MDQEQDLESLTNRRKRLRYRCTHCGMKEMDLILGAFADAHLESMGADELEQFEALVTVPDDLLYLWLSGREPVSSDHNTAPYRRLLALAQGGLR